MGSDDDFPIWQVLSVGLGFGARPAGHGWMDELICSLALFILCVSQQGNLTHKFKSHMYLFPREDSSLRVVPRYMKEENEMK